MSVSHCPFGALPSLPPSLMSSANKGLKSPS
jgi:hypothetical protein